MTPSKARKLAEREAEHWETKLRKELGMDSWTPEAEKEKGQADSCVEFSDFVREVWFPLCIENGEYKAKTVSFYNDTAKNIANYFEGYSLQGVGFIAIQKFFVYLRRERGYSSQYIHHHYRTLNSIFSFATKQGIITENPMLKVDRPKLERKKVEALTPEEARLFFEALIDCPLAEAFGL